MSTPEPSVPDMIRGLRSAKASPYRLHGGAAALCRELSIHAQTLKAWRSGKAEPTYGHWQALKALWERYCGGGETPCEH